MLNYFYRIRKEDRTENSIWYGDESTCVNDCVKDVSEAIRKGEVVKGANVMRLVTCYEAQDKQFSYLLVNTSGDRKYGKWHEDLKEAIDDAMTHVNGDPDFFDTVIIMSRRG